MIFSHSGEQINTTRKTKISWNRWVQLLFMGVSFNMHTLHTQRSHTQTHTPHRNRCYQSQRDCVFSYFPSNVSTLVWNCNHKHWTNISMSHTLISASDHIQHTELFNWTQKLLCLCLCCMEHGVQMNMNFRAKLSIQTALNFEELLIFMIDHWIAIWCKC